MRLKFSLKFITSWVFRYIYLLAYVIIIRIRYGFGDIVFAHGSTGDTFSIAAFIDAYADQHGRSLIIISADHREVFARFVSHSQAVLIVVSEKRCQRIRVAWHIIVQSLSYFKILKVVSPTNFITPAHIALYPEINSQFRLFLQGEGGVHYVDCLKQVLHLTKDTPVGKPTYSDQDYADLAAIINFPFIPIEKVALINPICYSSANLSEQFWRSIGLALQDIGYYVVFNIRKNANDNRNYVDIIPLGFSSISLPAYLCPLAANQVGLICGRSSGGFNLLHSFASPKKSLHILIESDEISWDNFVDLPKEIALRTLKGYNDIPCEYCIVVSFNDIPSVVYTKIRTEFDGNPPDRP